MKTSLQVRRRPWDSPDRRNELLLSKARIHAGHSVLDMSLYGRFGHGTEPISLLVKRAQPQAHVVGLYDDRAPLRLASQRIRESGLSVSLVLGSVLAPPFRAESFDRIVSSLLFHHLPMEAKRLVLSSAYRLLKAGGEMYIVDWGTPQNPILSLTFLAVRLSDGFATTSDNVSGRLIPLMREVGFNEASEDHREVALPGMMALYRAVKRPSGSQDERNLCAV